MAGLPSSHGQLGGVRQQIMSDLKQSSWLVIVASLFSTSPQFFSILSALRLGGLGKVRWGGVRWVSLRTGSTGVRAPRLTLQFQQTVKCPSNPAPLISFRRAVPPPRGYQSATLTGRELRLMRLFCGPLAQSSTLLFFSLCSSSFLSPPFQLVPSPRAYARL